MTPQRDPRAYVEDILEAIANIEADTDGLDFNQFTADRRVRRLPDETKAADPDVPWREIAGIATSFGTIMALFGPTYCGVFGHSV